MCTGARGQGSAMSKIIVGLVLIGIVFLIGFFPQYVKVARLEEDLASCQLRGQLSELRDLAALMYLEASQKNYGLAGGTFYSLL